MRFKPKEEEVRNTIKMDWRAGFGVFFLLLFFLAAYFIMSGKRPANVERMLRHMEKAQ